MTYQEFLRHLHKLPRRRSQKTRVPFVVRPWGGIRTAETIYVSRHAGPYHCGLPPISAVAFFCLGQPLLRRWEVDIGTEVLGLSREDAGRIYWSSYEWSHGKVPYVADAKCRRELLRACGIRTTLDDQFRQGEDFNTKHNPGTRYIEDLARNGWAWPLRRYRDHAPDCEYAEAAKLGRTHSVSHFYAFYEDLIAAGWRPQLRITDPDNLGDKRGAMFRLEIVVSCFRHKGDGPGERIVSMMHMTKKNIGISQALSYVMESRVGVRNVPPGPRKPHQGEQFRHLDFGPAPAYEDPFADGGAMPND